MVPLIDGPRFTLRVSLLLPILWMGAIVTGRVTQFAVLFVSITAHECCHAAVLQAFSYPVSRMDLTPMGAFLVTEAETEQQPTAECLMALAGPLFNLGAAVLLEALRRRGVEAHWMQEAIRVNVTLALFNLLPALPLDGGHILRATLSRSLGLGRASRITAAVGFLLAGGIAALGLYLRVQFGISRPEMGMIAVLLLLTGLRTLNAAAWLGIRTGECKRERLRSQGLLPIENVVIEPTTRIAALLPRLSPKKYHIFLVVDAEGQTLGSFTEERLIAHLHSKNPVTAGDILPRCLRDPFACATI